VQHPLPTLRSPVTMAILLSLYVGFRTESAPDCTRAATDRAKAGPRLLADSASLVRLGASETVVRVLELYQ
jgi:hypothetical protein